jgi:hypothetical protein
MMQILLLVYVIALLSCIDTVHRKVKSETQVTLVLRDFALM